MLKDRGFKLITYIEKRYFKRNYLNKKIIDEIEY